MEQQLQIYASNGWIMFRWYEELDEDGNGQFERVEREQGWLVPGPMDSPYASNIYDLYDKTSFWLQTQESSYSVYIAWDWYEPNKWYWVNIDTGEEGVLLSRVAPSVAGTAPLESDLDLLDSEPLETKNREVITVYDEGDPESLSIFNVYRNGTFFEEVWGMADEEGFVNICWEVPHWSLVGDMWEIASWSSGMMYVASRRDQQIVCFEVDKANCTKFVFTAPSGEKVEVVKAMNGLSTMAVNDGKGSGYEPTKCVQITPAPNIGDTICITFEYPGDGVEETPTIARCSDCELAK